jgi:hypothetical protein
MNHRTSITAAALTLLALAPISHAAAIPADAETPATSLDRLYSYFGVSSFALTSTNQPVFSGASMALTINFTTSIFPSAGVGIGTLGVSAPALAVTPGADTFSITITGPATGSLRFYVTVREDDNNDGVIDLTLGDDEWISPELVIPAATTTTFNIPAAQFTNTGVGTGDGVREFDSTNRMAMLIDIHSKTSYPGGLITTPRTIYLDHAGFFIGAQTPPPPCTGDLNIDGIVNTVDLTMFLSHFGQTISPGTQGDLNNDGAVNTQDLTRFLSAFGQPC